MDKLNKLIKPTVASTTVAPTQTSTTSTTASNGLVNKFKSYFSFLTKPYSCDQTSWWDASLVVIIFPFLVGLLITLVTYAVIASVKQETLVEQVQKLNPYVVLGISLGIAFLPVIINTVITKKRFDVVKKACSDKPLSKPATPAPM